MDFGQALTALKDSSKVTREGWNGKDMWVALSPGFSLGPDRVFSPAVREAVEQAGHDGVFRSYLMMRTVDGEFVPWVASQTDLLAEDWRTA
jgi:hypothetical protein